MRVQAAIMGCLSLGACSLPEQRADFTSVDPQERTLALGKSAAAGDQSAIPSLITMLASDDPGTRLLAIRALERLTGQTHGYDYTASATDRHEAIRRWVAWQGSRSNPEPASPPADAAPGL